MALLLIFAGADYNAYLSVGTLSITDKVDARNTAAFVIRDTGDGNPSAPAIGNTVQIGDSVDSAKNTAESIEIDETVIDVESGAAASFAAGEYIVIDTEIMKVASVDTGADTLTVVRAAMGTSQATHASPVNIFDWTVYFAGSVDSINTVPFGGQDEDARKYEISCVDWNQIFDRFVIAKRYESTGSGAIAKSLINDTGLYPQARTADTLNSLEGVTGALTTDGTPGLIYPGVNVSDILFNYETVTSALNMLAAFTGYYWTLDFNKELIFGEFGGTATAITEANKGTHILKGSERKMQTRDQYRNVQYLRGGFAVEAAITETRNTSTSAAWKTSIQLQRPVGAAIADGDILDAGSAITNGVGVKNLTTGKGAYYQIGSNEIELSGISGTPTISVTYKGQVPIMLQAANEDAIAERSAAEGGSGQYAMIETAPDINALSGFDRGKALVDRYGTLPATMTYQSDTLTFNTGDSQTVTLDVLGLTAEVFIISSRRLYDRGAGKIRASYELEDGLHRKNWIDWYTKVYRNQLRSYDTNEVISYARTVETVADKPAPF